MFTSGPTHYNGYSNQNLYIFILDMESGESSEIDTSIANAFGGRLFTDGLDVNMDGQTDYVFFGYTQTPSGGISFGRVIAVWTGSTNPSEWDFFPLNIKDNFIGLPNLLPITAKIEVGKCFDRWYLFFGTGRYFYKDDNHYSTNDVNSLYGIPFTCGPGEEDFEDCKENYLVENMRVYYVESLTELGEGEDEDEGEDENNNICDSIGDPTGGGAWKIYLDPKILNEDGTLIAYRERNISDPTFASNMVFFATTQPTADTCGFGGKSRAWALNCATGESITSSDCTGATVDIPQFKYLLQLSGGNIEEYGEESFTEEGGRATVKVFGITPDAGGSLVLPGGGTATGEILLWIEK